MMTKPHIIVLGNEKGGTGKSTLAMHIIVHLLKEGKRVSSVDLDGRQGSLTYYIKNRNSYAQQTGIALSEPEHIAVEAAFSPVPEKIKEDLSALDELITELKETSDYIVIDTPGSDNYLMRAGHGYADTLITPVNESLIDVNVLGRVDFRTNKVEELSRYAESVFEARKRRALERKPPLNWFVVKNRLSNADNRNRHVLDEVLEQLAKRLNFQVLPPLRERVIYRELFLKGLTMLDLRTKGIGVKMGVSHIAARHEIQKIMDAVTGTK